MTAPLHNAKLGLMLPAILNPATAAVVGIGLGLLWLLRDDEQETTVDAAPIKRAKPTARTDAQRVPAVETLPDKIVPEAREAVPAGTELLSNLVFEDCWSCGDLVWFCDFNSVIVL